MEIIYSFKLINDRGNVITSRKGEVCGDISHYAFELFDKIEQLLIMYQRNNEHKETPNESK